MRSKQEWLDAINALRGKHALNNPLRKAALAAMQVRRLEQQLLVSRREVATLIGVVASGIADEYALNDALRDFAAGIAAGGRRSSTF